MQDPVNIMDLRRKPYAAALPISGDQAISYRQGAGHGASVGDLEADPEQSAEFAPQWSAGVPPCSSRVATPPARRQAVPHHSERLFEVRHHKHTASHSLPGLTSEGSNQLDRVGMGVRTSSSMELPGWTLPVAAPRGRPPKQPTNRVFRLLPSQLVTRLVQLLVVFVQVNGLHL